MIRARVPLSRVRNVLEVDGKDPSIVHLDPNLSLASQIRDDDDDDSDDSLLEKPKKEVRHLERNDSPKSVLQFHGFFTQRNNPFSTGSPLKAVSVTERDAMNQELLRQWGTREFLRSIILVKLARVPECL
mmetsp:Transcript_23127/g.33575  ORF Transcript_23127/g.33575 Transcript_23127/m.33575 type:complete len:130 (-) Transcript_23127:1378-1767(-)